MTGRLFWVFLGQGSLHVYGDWICGRLTDLTAAVSVGTRVGTTSAVSWLAFVIVRNGSLVVVCSRGALYWGGFRSTHWILEFTPGIVFVAHEDTIKNKNKYLRNPSVALSFSVPSQSQWSIWPILVQWSLDELELRNKKENVGLNERKRMVLRFRGFAQLVTPGQVNSLTLN